MKNNAIIISKKYYLNKCKYDKLSIDLCESEYCEYKNVLDSEIEKYSTILVKLVINSNNKQKFIFEFSCEDVNCKLWLNEKFISYSEEWIHSFLLDLNRGNNEIKIEFYGNDVEEIKNIHYRIDIANKESIKLISLSKKILCHFENNLLKYVFFTSDVKQKFKYLISGEYFIDHINTKYDIISEFIGNKNTIFEKKVYENKYFSIIINIYDCSKDKLIDVKRIMLFDVNDKINYICQYLRTIECKYNYINNYLEYYLKKVENLNDNSLKIYFIKKILDDLKVLNKYDNFSHYLLNYREINKIIYKSNIDNQLYSFSVKLPKKIKKNMQIILILASYEDGIHIEKFSNFFHEKYIIIECPIRGFSMGSYISESTINEVLEIVRNVLKFDFYNINVFGYSNSGTAALNIISKMQNFFNAGYIVAANFDNDKLNQIDNTYIKIISGENDYKVPKYVSHKKNISIKIVKNMDHNLIYNYLYDFKSIKKFLYNSIKYKKSVSINEYEYKEIELVIATDNYNFHVIKKEKNKLFIKYYGVKIVKLKKIMDYLFIDCNNNEILIKNIRENSLYNLIEKKFIIEEELINSRGIISSYNDKMEILINSEKDIQYVKFLETPKTMTINQKIHIKYPIIIKKTLDINENYNYFIFNFNLNEYPLKLLIKCENEYFEFNGKRFYGSYIVVQNAFNFKNYMKNCTFINTNEILLLKKCFFTRNIYLNTSVNNKKNIYNYSVLIFLNSIYYYLDMDKMTINKL